jgi:alpha-tubulin suppressor-like RCC1 family protein
MRIPRIVLALVLVGTPVTTLAMTATAVLAEPFTYTAVDTTQDATCALTTDGTAMCWGENRDSWLIASSRERVIDLPAPVRLPNNDRFVSLNGGGNHTWCGLAISGTVYCWGEHHLGNVFIPTSKTPVAVEFASTSTITKVGSGYSIGCALNTLGELWCWGDVLDTGSGETEPTRTPVRVVIPSPERVVDFDLGGTPCAITDIGNIYCWGHQNEGGQLGLGYRSSIAYAVSVVPSKVLTPEGLHFVSVTTGLEHGCALTSIGTGYCWGENYQGLFGNNTYNNSYVATPMTPPNSEPIAQITTGWYHTCILTTSHKTWCAGRNDYGEFGTGTTLGGKTFRNPALPSDIYFTSLTASLSGTCGLDQNNDVWCFGNLSRYIATAVGQTPSLFPQMIPRVGSPTVVTSDVTDIGAEGALIRGSVNANGYATTTRIEYDTSSDFIRATSFTVSSSLRDRNFSTYTMSHSLLQLEPRTSYFARLVATNALGTTYGNAVEFSTIGDVPRMDLPVVSDITGNEASISVTVQPGLLSTTSTLHYSTDASCTTACIEVPLAVSTGADTVALTTNLDGLHAQTTYFASVTARNKLGSVATSIFSFTTVGELAKGVITSHSATNTALSADVRIETGQLAGSVSLEASTTKTFLLTSTSSAVSFASDGPYSHRLTVSALSAHTDYFVRVVTTNELGTTRSQAISARTLGGAPQIAPPTFETEEESAVLHASLNTTGLDTFVTALLSTHSDMTHATEFFVYAGSRSHEIDLALSDLVPRTTYYVTVTASNEVGSTTSLVQSFTTRTPLGVLINGGDATTSLPAVTLTLTAPPNVAAVRVSNYASFQGARVYSPNSSIEWTLLVSTEPTQERTVWIQFVLADGKTSEFSDIITLSAAIDSETNAQSPVTSIDSSSAVLAPVISVRVSKTTSAPVARVATIKVKKSSSRILRLQTKSGRTVTTRRISANKSGKYVVTIPTSVTSMMVRLIDAKGTASKWKKVV